jgi:hypothetical protein
MNTYKHLIGWHIWVNVLLNVEVFDAGIYMITDIHGRYYLLLQGMHKKNLSMSILKMTPVNRGSRHRIFYFNIFVIVSSVVERTKNASSLKPLGGGLIFITSAVHQ